MWQYFFPPDQIETRQRLRHNYSFLCYAKSISESIFIMLSGEAVNSRYE